MTTSWVPHPYQIEGVKFLLQNSNAGLWWSPGCGKTACVYAAIKILLMKQMIRRVIIVAPMRVATSVWPTEKDKWTDFAGLRLVVLHGPKKMQLIDTPADIYVMTPEGFKEFQRLGLLARIGADMLVIDESSYFRHHTSQRFKSVKLALTNFKRRVTLTGTPAPNGYLDLWSQAYIMDMGGALERFVTHYRGKYFTDIGFQFPDLKMNLGADKLIDAKLQPLVLREDAIDHLQMPLLIENTILCKLPPDARRQYDAMEKHFYLALSDTEVAAVTAAAKGTKLRQIANGFVYDVNGKGQILHDEKLTALSALLAELNGQQALIFYEFVQDRDRISRLLHNAPDMSNCTPIEANKLILGFNEGSVQYLLAHPASAGHGINLQNRAQHVIWYGPTWNLEHKIQATARVWRQGNPHERVFVHTIVAENTKDQDVAAALGQKDVTQSALLAAMKRRRT